MNSVPNVYPRITYQVIPILVYTNDMLYPHITIETLYKNSENTTNSYPIITFQINPANLPDVNLYELVVTQVQIPNIDITLTNGDIFSVSVAQANKLQLQNYNYLTQISAPPIPVPGFNFILLKGTLPTPVQFVDISTNHTDFWIWEVTNPDGGIVNFEAGPTPIYTFDQAGVYSVTLTTGNAAGYVSITQDITIGPPVASFNANVRFLTAQFTDTSTGNPSSWLWNFGDGNTSIIENPIHTYASSGGFSTTYTVVLTASNDAGSDTTNQPVTVNSPIVINYTASGGLNSGGTGLERDIFRYIASGGLNSGGTSLERDIFYYIASGGLNNGGRADHKFMNYSWTASGGLSGSGSSISKIISKESNSTFGEFAFGECAFGQ